MERPKIDVWSGRDGLDVLVFLASSTQMERALIIGASGGIGSALAAGLREKDVEVTELSRSRDGVDVTDEASVAAALGALEEPYSKIIVATGALEIAGAAPEKSIGDWSSAAMLNQLALNAVGPAMVLKHALPLLPKSDRSILAVLSARVGSIGDNRLGGWVSYRAAKAAVNQVVRTCAVELARTHKEAICVALHPGTVATDFTRKYLGRHPAVAPAEAAENLLRVMDRLTLADSGGFFDWAGEVVPW
jgi:NAD(P)-dependent dehydrogenase (short-subunit alcohol dehydrogenase family)